MVVAEAQEGWDAFHKDLVRKPEYREEQESLYKDSFIAGVVAAYAIIRRE